MQLSANLKTKVGVGACAQSILCAEGCVPLSPSPAPLCPTRAQDITFDQDGIIDKKEVGSAVRLRKRNSRAEAAAWAREIGLWLALTAPRAAVGCLAYTIAHT